MSEQSEFIFVFEDPDNRRGDVIHVLFGSQEPVLWQPYGFAFAGAFGHGLTGFTFLVQSIC
jgi:hypothetical protein